MSETESERFSFRKWIGGFVNPLNFGKAIVQIWHIGIVLLMIFSFIVTGLWIKSKVLGNKKTLQPIKIDSITGGSVHASNDVNSKKFGILNF